MRLWSVLLFTLSLCGCDYLAPKAKKNASASKPAYDLTADPKANRVFTRAQWQEEVLDSKEPILVDFWAPWCGPCREMGPIIEALAQQFKVVKVNIDENPDLTRRYEVQEIPLLLIFKNGQIAMRFRGYTEEDDLRKGMLHVQAKKS
jgi:thioredoxin 1